MAKSLIKAKGKTTVPAGGLGKAVPKNPKAQPVR